MVRRINLIENEGIVTYNISSMQEIISETSVSFNQRGGSGMRVTYLEHSGFFLEWEDCIWIFDYYRGELPKLNMTKPVFVFCSHSHSDHFNSEIFSLLREHPQIHYIFSNEIRKKIRTMQRKAASDTEHETVPEITFLTVRTDAKMQDGSGNTICIHTLASTDCGCAFVLEYKGRTIFHAGDLHWWTWPGEPEADNRKMESDYKKEVEYLEKRAVDLAFTPLDPRQEEDYAKGMTYLLSRVQVHHVFPMHFWGDFSVMEQFKEECTLPRVRFDEGEVYQEGAQSGTCFHPIRKNGQIWEITL